MTNEKSEELTHFNADGRARMVDVSDKARTRRTAQAECTVRLRPETLRKIVEGTVKKGDVLAVAQVAGILGAKRTAELIPMCHPLLLTGVDLHFSIDRAQSCIVVRSEVKTTGETGVEMEALVACSTAALTIYDMCKAMQRDIEMTDLHLVRKEGGKSGLYERQAEQAAHVVAVSRSAHRGTAKTPQSEIHLRVSHGIEGDAHAGSWHRQVSLLGAESLRKAQAALPSIGPGSFAENILTEGIVLHTLPVGTILQVGEVRLRITQIGKECHQGCAIRQQTGDCVMPREGVFAVVLNDGVVRPGDAIALFPSDEGDSVPGKEEA